VVLVRHGESAGNLASDRAEASGELLIAVATRDMDVPLSPFGRRQATAVGEWMRTLGRPRPRIVVSSPYERAHETATLAVAASGLGIPIVLDERLREREFGILDRLTHAGVAARFPEQAEARSRVGKFYHRPPGGESWCDVALRVRSLIDTVSREHAGEHVCVVAHQVVILMFCYVLQSLTEREVLELDRREQLANCSITRFVRRRGRPAMERVEFNSLVALQGDGAPVTREPDVPVAPR
jgi:broad specificity phosphatase PhoE